MLLNISVLPELFGKTSVVDSETKTGAIVILQALLANAIAITDLPDFGTQLLNQVSGLDAKHGQHLSIYAVEVVKLRKLATKVVATSGTATTLGARVAALARMGISDLGVCAHASDRAAASTSMSAPIRLLAEYPYSPEEALRRAWGTTQELKDLPTSDCTALLSRAFPSSKKLIVADKMLGRAAKDNVSAELGRFARGVIFLASCGASAAQPREVCVITEAGNAGGRAGYIDPIRAAANIRTAVNTADIGRVISKLTIDLKQESDPPVFRDRLAACAGRCWGIRHGVDDFGKLTAAPASRSPTFIDPDCVANRRLLALIQRLPAAK